MKFLLLLTGCLFAGKAICQTESRPLFIKNVNIIDGTGTKIQKKKSVLLKENTISEIEKANTEPPLNARVIDLKGKYLLPGFIDAHVHFYAQDSVDAAVRSGVTTVRNMGSNNLFDVQLSKDHKAGKQMVPEVFASGYAIRPDMPAAFYILFPELNDTKPLIRGTENVRRVVRAMVAKGVTLIKIFATERAGIPDMDPRKRTWTDEELSAIVDEARLHGIFIAAHAHGDEGAYAAVVAGARSIEHGTFLTDRTLLEMKSRNTFLVPTFCYWEQEALRESNMKNPVLKERINTYPTRLTEVLSRANKIGVKIAAGTDTRYSVPGLTLADEAIKMQSAGLSPMEVIKTMTSQTAACLGIENRTGSIKKGLEADLVILDENPLKNLVGLQSIFMVINNGKIVYQRK